MPLAQNVTSVAAALRVLVRSGFIDPLRPDVAVKAMSAVRRYGTFGGAVGACRSQIR